mgnify:CR=1 FL=1
MLVFLYRFDETLKAETARVRSQRRMVKEKLLDEQRERAMKQENKMRLYVYACVLLISFLLFPRPATHLLTSVLAR